MAWHPLPTGSGSRPSFRAAIVGLALLTTGCERDDPNRIDVDVIGDPPRLGDPDRETLTDGRALMMRETAMGLVSFDASGQVEPALAESWIVTDDGRSIIFRIERATWPDDSEVTGDQVAASLKRATEGRSENVLKPLLTAVDAFVGMTGRVIEVRLKTPRPNLLQLLAQPQLGIRRDGAGLGPWRIAGREGQALVLKPIVDPADATDTPDARIIHLRGGRAALAIARFSDRQTDIVLGGTIADLPVVQAAEPRTGVLRRDPALGLFGLGIYPRSPFLKERSLREALAMAIDRPALTKLVGNNVWTPSDRLLPAQLDSGQVPATADWTTQSPADRRVTARARIASWIAARGPLPPLRVAMPRGPGMRLVFAQIHADWRAIGVRSVRVGFGDKNADLRMIDEVAPNSSANWYLTRTGCAYGLACTESADMTIVEARGAATLGARAAALARADAAAAHDAGYIPLAQPLRWSLVSPALSGFRENSFAIHPLGQLRPAPRNN